MCWDPVLNSIDPNTSWERFLELFRPVCDQHAPFKKIRILSQLPPWLTQENFSASDNSRHLFRIYKKNKTPENKVEADRAKNFAIMVSKLLESQYVSNKVEECKNDSKK